MQDNHLIIKLHNSDNVITENININFKMLHSNNGLVDWTEKHIVLDDNYGKFVINNGVVDVNIAIVNDNITSVSDNTTSVSDNIASVNDNIASVGDNIAIVSNNIVIVGDKFDKINKIVNDFEAKRKKAYSKSVKAEAKNSINCNNAYFTNFKTL